MNLTKRSDEVAILLCTYHGEEFLPEQLQSFDYQTHTNWKLHVSDDSHDNFTFKVLQKFQGTHQPGKVHIRPGIKKGFAKNFLSLACDENIIADYYAFSDQDDVWHPNKLAKAVLWLSTVATDQPAIYCSRSQLINAHGKKLRLSYYFKKPPHFANALVQNIAGGNTMVFNHAARSLLMHSGLIDVSAHDWWLYIAVTASGGTILYDDLPSIDYRQHDNNTIGIKPGFQQKLKSFRTVMKGQFKNNNDYVIAALNNLQAHITPENKIILNQFKTARQSSVLKRLVGIRRSGVHRQTLAGNLALAFSVLLNRV